MLYTLALMAAVVWGLYSNLARRWTANDESGSVHGFFLCTGTALLMISFLIPDNSTFNLPVLIEILFMSVSTGIGYWCWDFAMRRGNVVLVAALSYLTPFFSTLVSSFYLGVDPKNTIWIGCALIILGSFLSWKSISDR